jgi:sigma-B regulation protein RsbU (phosphoserine phosphatase)
MCHFRPRLLMFFMGRLCTTHSRRIHVAFFKSLSDRSARRLLFKHLTGRTAMSTTMEPLSVNEVARETMSCMEVWGGNRSTWSDFVVPGLDLWVYSQPYGAGDMGGDVYYLSSCASGRVTRMLLADVSGHGAEAAPLGGALRNIMRKNVNYIDQSRVVESLNTEFEAASSVGRFATAIVSTYFSPTRELSVCTAGHPPPLIYRAASRQWEPLEGGNMDLRNMPLGIMGSQKFASTKLKLATGDILLGYSDALFESVNVDGSMLRADGLAVIANSLDVTQPDVFVQQLLQRIRDMNPDNLISDDATVTIARANEQGVAFKDNVLAPFRFLRRLFGR